MEKRGRKTRPPLVPFPPSHHLPNPQVVLKTTHGDLDIELWPREAPLACRNFVQLALEGGYDGSPFHRIVADLAIQTGVVATDDASDDNPSGSVYGAPFKDEFHSRLRFTHRGLVACAGGNNANGSQFFITTAPAPQPHLDRKHTIFGRVAGATIHTVAAIAGVEVDSNDAPLPPAPRVLEVDVLWNPFDDIVVRTTREERAAKAEAAAAAAKKAAADAARAAAVKKPQLLSFGGGGEEEEEEEEGCGPLATVPRRGMVSAHDAAADGKLAAATDADAVEAVAAARARVVAAGGRGDGDGDGGADAAAFAERMAARVVGRAAGGGPPPPPDGDGRAVTKRPAPAEPEAPPPQPADGDAATGRPSKRPRPAAASTALNAWQARRAAFTGRTKAGAKKREGDTLDRLTSFTAALRQAGKEGRGGGGGHDAAPAATQTPALYSGEIRPDADADLPVAWRVAAYLGGGGEAPPPPSLADLATHRLVAPRPSGTGSAALAASDGLETIDPLADGRAARGEEEGGRRGGSDRRERRGGGRRR